MTKNLLSPVQKEKMKKDYLSYIARETENTRKGQKEMEEVALFDLLQNS